jgi:hypothetical protein
MFDLMRMVLYPVLYCYPMLRPGHSKAKLPVDAIYRLSASMEPLSGRNAARTAVGGEFPALALSIGEVGA